MTTVRLISAHDPLRLRGDLTIVTRDASGRQLKRIAIRNLITFNGIGGVLQLWKQDGILASDFQIASLQVGTDPTPPTRADTALGAPVPVVENGTIALAPANRTLSLPTGELVITAMLGLGDALGPPVRVLSEAGLLYGNASLAARQIHPLITKTALITVSYTWRLAATA